uniref:SAC domain-containing protein n=1 Tax=Heterorhabditis bacteriophora TaxID=37862 RepID=A0A1I7WES2_HETBA
MLDFLALSALGGHLHRNSSLRGRCVVHGLQAAKGHESRLEIFHTDDNYKTYLTSAKFFEFNKYIISQFTSRSYALFLKSTMSISMILYSRLYPYHDSHLYVICGSVYWLNDILYMCTLKKKNRSDYLRISLVNEEEVFRRIILFHNNYIPKTYHNMLSDISINNVLDWILSPFARFHS